MSRDTVSTKETRLSETAQLQKIAPDADIASPARLAVPAMQAGQQRI